MSVCTRIFLLIVSLFLCSSHSYSQREREQWQASEKIRREQWQQKESRSVLERTRKQLEPEIQRLIDGNREALRRVETDKQV